MTVDPPTDRDLEAERDEARGKALREAALACEAESHMANVSYSCGHRCAESILSLIDQPKEGKDNE